MGKWVCALNAALMVACLILAVVVVSTACRTMAVAQVAGEVGSIVAVTGPPRPTDDQPLFLADTKNQQLMIYEYQPQLEQFALTAVRNVAYDSSLISYNRSKKAIYPTPEDIRKMVARQTK